ncbi:MAG: hypothetical protein CMH61_00380 [Nanoarchaeota archaeon]|nr:hypothetical protein [Nanoarchaeota archaeon]|tara:strand:+ start:654 stop:1790 length:1137 start_codon:yes stop_codon:yes gene_type:complete
MKRGLVFFSVSFLLVFFVVGCSPEAQFEKDILGDGSDALAGQAIAPGEETGCREYRSRSGGYHGSAYSTIRHCKELSDSVALGYEWQWGTRGGERSWTRSKESCSRNRAETYKCLPDGWEKCWQSCEQGCDGLSCSAPACEPTSHIDNTCDGVDDDCDGWVDDDLTLADGQCTVPGELGMCAFGLRSCVSGEWTACGQNAQGGPERCDNQDNDCDGETDEDVIDCGDGEMCRDGACVDTTCTDTDGGINLNVQGTGTGEYGTVGVQTFTDYCNAVPGPYYEKLIEYHCENNYLQFHHYDCPSGSECSNGACVSLCVDDDPENDPSFAGNADNPIIGHRDSCNSAGQLRQSECGPDGNWVTAGTVDCSAGTVCQDGACV